MDLNFSPEREPFAPPRARRSGTWTDSLKSGKSRKSSAMLEHESLRSLSPLNDSEDDIPLISEFEEIQDDDYLGDISEAPDAPLNPLASLSQLNPDFKKYSAFAVVDNVNLGLLTKHLYKEEDLNEGDNGWSWDLLFTEVSSQLRSQ